MKRKYSKQLKQLVIICLSFFISIGSFIGLFAINAVQASAYNTTTTGQLQLESGVCYNGQNPNHPFIYTTERMAINANTYLPPYKRGNDGAGGNIGGTAELLLKRINTGSAWSSVPLYRVSRSGGYSDDLPYVTGDAINIVNGRQIQNAINSLSGINRQVSRDEAEMIQQVYANGFKAGLETTGVGNSYSWDDYLRCAATQIIALEIQEGKRWSFGTADGNYRQEADTVGTNPWYWKQWWDNEVMARAYSGATNWYYRIIEMCQATSDSMSVTADSSGSSAAVSAKKSNAGTLNASYLSDGRYQLAFHLSNSNLWGDKIGQFNAAGVEWIPDDGSRGAELSWSGGNGYLTSNWSNPNEPISGYLKFTQNASNTAFNDIGYMSGSTSNSWRGFMFGGNSTSTELWLRVGSTGGPTPMTVKFVDENGSPVNVDWNFQVNDTGITEFSENSSGKTFVPQFYLDNHTQANYKINLTSIPKQYQLPKELTTLFYYHSDTGVVKHGTDPGSTGWGSWDYGACQASFSGNTITITLKAKNTAPITINVVDGGTGNLVTAATYTIARRDYTDLTPTRVIGKASYTYTPRFLERYAITINALPVGYDVPNEKIYFDYSTGDLVSAYPDYLTDINYDVSPRILTIFVYKTGETPDKNQTGFAAQLLLPENYSGNPDMSGYDIILTSSLMYYNAETGRWTLASWGGGAPFGSATKTVSMTTGSAGFVTFGKYDTDEQVITKKYRDQYTTDFKYKINYAMSIVSQGTNTELYYDSSVYDGGSARYTTGGWERFQLCATADKPDPKPEEPKPDETPADIDISFLTPNSDYHFGEEVISSYYLKNKNDRAYNPTTTELSVKLTLEKVDKGTTTAVGSTEITNVVCPSNATQLIYFKWSVPQLISTGSESWQLHTYVYDSNGKQVTESVDAVTVATKTQTDTPPNEFDLNGGKSFMPVSPLTKNQDYYNSSSWQQYEWENGGYVVKTYSAKLWNDEITVYPDETNPSATLQNGKDITSRSGYGMKLRLKARIDQYEGNTEYTNANQVTAVQYAGAYYPEQNYSTENEKHSTLELTDAGFVFPVYNDSTYEPGEKGDGRKHFVPMWYPDGQYTVQCQTSGCWTPAGMIDYTDEANSVIIKGSLYDDWYSSGGGK